MTKTDSSYDEIKVLKNLEGVRQNLGMYAGNISDGSAYFQCLLEILFCHLDPLSAAVPHTHLNGQEIRTLHQFSHLGADDQLDSPVLYGDIKFAHVNGFR